jgi:UDP:flavonoid glycosyltransferase YjiC (YdhE family)
MQKLLCMLAPYRINSFKDIPATYYQELNASARILKHTDLFITHGGMNSTNEGYIIPYPDSCPLF